MGFGILFVPLVAGYLFVTRCHYTQFAAHRETGHRLVFRSAAWGLVFLALARVVTHLSEASIDGRWLVSNLAEVAPVPYVGTLALAFAFGPLAALLVNRVYPRSKGAMRAVRKDQNSLELLFMRSLASDSLVELTLRSGKAYTGWILNADIADPERKFIEMLPLASGFRDSDTHELRFTTNYAAVMFGNSGTYSESQDPLDETDFRVVVPVSEVRSARPFDFRAPRLIADSRRLRHL